VREEMADREMPEEVFRLAVHNQVHDLLGQIICDEGGVFETSLINELRNRETGDRFADAASLI
jgi:hypothetical protein